jgi:polyisoprenoid-binding protein YceI
MESVWTIDETRSSIEFCVSYLTFQKTTGRFTRFGGTVHLDPEDLASGWAEVRIDPASIETGVGDRDRALREQGFFAVSAFPSAVFRARRLEPRALDRSRLFGDLTLHGVKREIELELTTSPARREMGPRRMRFAATGRINRKVFGIDWNPMFDFVPIFIGHWVDLKIAVEIVEQHP